MSGDTPTTFATQSNNTATGLTTMTGKVTWSFEAGRGEYMSELAITAVSLVQSRIQEQVAMNVIKANAEAQQALAAMLAENSQRLAEISKQASARGGVDIYV